MGNIIRFRDQHQEVRLLLPWYANARLDEADRTWVEAHLSGCPGCQADLKAERLLGAGIGRLPADADPAWNAMLDRLQAASQPRSALIKPWRPAAGRKGRDAWRIGASWLGGAVAATIVLLLWGLLTLETTQPARYHALAAPPENRSGNVVVIFRPDASEQQIRSALTAGDARLVDGPTAADGYVLHVPPGERARALAKLRARSEIVLALPIDPGEQP
jgi:hypothetical protein